MQQPHGEYRSWGLAREVCSFVVWVRWRFGCEVGPVEFERQGEQNATIFTASAYSTSYVDPGSLALIRTSQLSRLKSINQPNSDFTA